MFNPNSYANMAHDQVDWAALAQQWIQMKDVTHQGQPQVNLSPFQEQQRLYSTPPPFGAYPGFHIDNSLVTQQSDNWTAPPIAHQHHTSDVGKDDWNNKHDVFPPVDSQYNTMFQQPHHHQHQSQNQSLPFEEPSNYWNSPMSSSQISIKFPPAKQDSYEHHHQQQQPHHHHHHHHDMSRSHQELDAIRRKQLPAWIREGLEKVEREKRRKQEKEEQDALKEQMREANMAMLSEQGDEGGVAPVVSKWTVPAMSTEDSDGELQDDKKPVKLKHKKESLEDRVKTFLTNLNNEENLDQLMLCVRRQLTKLLLNGTNEMMRTIAFETLERFKRKANQVKKTKAVATLKSESGAFGLTSYGGSDSEEEEEEASEEDTTADVNSNDDDDESSEEEIRIEMEKKKRTFQLMLLRRSSANGQQDEEAPTASSAEMSKNLSIDREVTSGENNKVRDEEPSSHSSSSSNHHHRAASVANGNDDGQKPDEKLPSGASGSGRRRAPSSPSSTPNKTRSRSRSRSKSRSHDKHKRKSKRSRSRSLEKRRYRSESKESSTRSHSRSRDPKKHSRKSRKSRSKSKSRDSRRKRQGRRSKQSRSSSRDRKKSKKRSRSKSKERKKHRKSRSRSSSRSRDTKKLVKSSERKRSKKSKSRSPERRTKKHSVK